MSTAQLASTAPESSQVGTGPSRPAAEQILVVEGLSTTLATSRGQVRAVDSVSFALGAGETLGIVGESGSGKSMLVRSIMDLVPSYADVTGQVLFEGQGVFGRSPAQRAHLWGPGIAMVFQDPMTSLNPVRTIGRQISDPLRYHLGLTRRAARQRALALLEMVSIPDAPRRLDQYPHELSGGMRQRVMIAIAISCQPRLLIADEPTTALDVTVQKEVLDLLGDLQGALGMSMILISHDLSVVAGRTQRTAVMYAGRFVEVASTGAIFSDGRHPYTAALLESVPGIDGPRRERLRALEGRPPDMLERPGGCAFRPRCDRAHNRCDVERPELQVVLGDGDHRVACFAARHNVPVAPSPAAPDSGS